MTKTRTRPHDQQSPPPAPRGRPDGPESATVEFERIYRSHVDSVTAYFARRSADPQTVADLTADTFVAAITSFASFDPRRGPVAAWVFGIARRVYASHCQARSNQQDKLVRLAGRRELDTDQVEELLERIDAEKAGRRLVTELTSMPDVDRAVIELVDLTGLRAKDAAVVLGLSPGAVRMRLMRARSRLRTALTDSNLTDPNLTDPAKPFERDRFSKPTAGNQRSE